LQQNKYTPKIASAARRKITGSGAPINKSRRRRQQIVGGHLALTAAAAFHASCFRVIRKSTKVRVGLMIMSDVLGLLWSSLRLFRTIDPSTWGLGF